METIHPAFMRFIIMCPYKIFGFSKSTTKKKGTSKLMLQHTNSWMMVPRKAGVPCNLTALLTTKLWRPCELVTWQWQ